MANPNSVSILENYLVPAFQSDILVMTDKTKTAGIFQSGTRQSVLTQGSLEIIFESLVDAVEPTTIKSAFPRSAAEKEVGFRWITGQEGINIQAEKPELGQVIETPTKAGQTIDAGNAGRVTATEDGTLFSRTIKTTQGITQIAWFESSSSLIECGVPLIKDAMSVSNTNTGQIPSILPEMKISTAGSSCGACGACGVCILCGEANAGIGAAALVALAALDASASAIRSAAKG